MYLAFFLTVVGSFTFGGYLAIHVSIRKEAILTKRQEAVIKGFADMMKWLGIISLFTLILISNLPSIILGVALAALVLSVAGMIHSMWHFLEAYGTPNH